MKFIVPKITIFFLASLTFMSCQTTKKEKTFKVQTLEEIEIERKQKSKRVVKDHNFDDQWKSSAKWKAINQYLVYYDGKIVNEKVVKGQWTGEIIGDLFVENTDTDAKFACHKVIVSKKDNVLSIKFEGRK